MSGNPLVMFEWRTRDASRLRAFYNAVFDWKYGEPAPTGWQPVKTGKRNRVESGIVTIPSDPNLPSGLICFFGVDDLEKAEERVRAHGGQVVLSARETANGRFTLFRDVDFNQVGLWEEKKKGKGKVLDPVKVAERTARKAAQKLKKQAERVAREQKRAQKAAERAAAKATKKAAQKAEKTAQKAQKAAKKAQKATPPTPEELQRQTQKAHQKEQKKAEAKAAKKAAQKAEKHAPITSAPTLVPTPDKR